MHLFRTTRKAANATQQTLANTLLAIGDTIVTNSCLENRRLKLDLTVNQTNGIRFGELIFRLLLQFAWEKVVVLDNGSGDIKVGTAADKAPRYAHTLARGLDMVQRVPYG